MGRGSGKRTFVKWRANLFCDGGRSRQEIVRESPLTEEKSVNLAVHVKVICFVVVGVSERGVSHRHLLF